MNINNNSDLSERLSMPIGNESTMPHFKYFPIILTLFSAILLTSHVAALKLVSVFGVTLTGGFIVFPFSYVLNCIAVEVYGYKNARLAIWCGFLLNFVFVIFIDIVAFLPPSPYWGMNEEFKRILTPETRIVTASLISFLIADFANSYFMAKHKIKLMGKSLFIRVMGASLISIIIGVIIFIGLAYGGTIPNHVLYKLIIFAFLKKLIFQLVFFPITAYTIYALKRCENVDIYDHHTNFNPFSIDNIYDLDSFRLKGTDDHASR